ncbi:hypothetical protein O181_100927 [Austropuccinia psidii MF-1]|uniref:Secreted protein n=1 Tax=Austropuccinia psidii MF-1 TaxID=1389203 RepID=A0A9Q3JG76_9BASI|nr:hypothetical protein [Austropuccinia psidii MF-1]
MLLSKLFSHGRITVLILAPLALSRNVPTFPGKRPGRGFPRQFTAPATCKMSFLSFNDGNSNCQNEDTMYSCKTYSCHINNEDLDQLLFRKCWDPFNLQKQYPVVEAAAYWAYPSGYVVVNPSDIFLPDWLYCELNPDIRPTCGACRLK